MNKDVYTVYVLFTRKFDKIYIGYTSNLIQRFYSHNTLGKKGWTIKFRPWIVVYTEYFSDISQARKREKYLKSYQGRKFLREFIDLNYPN